MSNIKYISLFLSIVFIVTIAGAQENSFEKVSKQYSLIAGYSNISKSTVKNIAISGYTIEFDYSWKLSGYNKKKSTFITVPIGFSSHNSKSLRNVNLLYYGWIVRHNLAKDKIWIPYLAYSLLLNQVWYQNTAGNDMGHQTRFTFGFDRRLNDFSALTIALNYSFIRFPGLGQNKSEKFTTISLVAGYRFGKG